MIKETYFFNSSVIFCRNYSTKKFSILILLLLVSNLIFGQSNNKLRQIIPKWKLGDEKLITNKSETKVFIKDSLINKTEVTSIYNIKVIDTVGNFTLQYSTVPNSIDVVMNSPLTKVDSITNLFTEVIKKIELETQTFKYELLVDKQSGQAIKVKNNNEFLKVIEHVTSKMIDELGQKFKKSNHQIDSIKQKVVFQFILSEPKILETILNQYNYIMQPYSYEFPYNSSIVEKTMVHDVNALGTLGGIEMPATITISSKKTNNILTVTTDTDYDKDFLLEIVKKKYKNISNLTTTNTFLSEKTESSFTLKNGWIISHKSVIVFETKEVKVISESIAIFK